MTLPESMLDQLFTNPKDKLTWKEWKASFNELGISILNDNISEDCEFTSDGAKSALLNSQFCVKECMVGPTVVSEQLVKAPEPESQKKEPLTREEIIEWSRKFQEIYKVHPQPNTRMTTDDGSKAKLEIELNDGKPPFVVTRAYVPMVVGSKLGWFIQKKGQKSNYGWKVILMPKSRDEVIKRFGLVEEMEVYVQSLTIVKLASTGHSLLAEIDEW